MTRDRKREALLEEWALGRGYRELPYGAEQALEESFTC